ncbi:G/T mismatch-specific thymine DNA glycosylase-like [Scleropages formosus]|uniref:G/T mismatch-specific thymine DNA glycosylase n=1 Tax=Scleropages formosus TaxID=113540 RepID=A0A8C9SJW9_SCLFO|nr:G/T mismatch-specific thymine DNA glycosylase-like [Scleropages formosus]
MEENFYSALTVPTDYLQHWYQSNQHVQALQATQYQQMPSMAHFMEGSLEDRVMTELAVHQDSPAHREPSFGSELPVYQESAFSCEPAAHNQPSFSCEPPLHQESPVYQEPTVAVSVQTPTKGKRGRPPNKPKDSNQEEVEEGLKKVKRKVDRFNGMSVDEVMAKTLPDVLAYNLDILIIGINPGLMSAYIGHHYPNPGNHFWKCLFMAGLTDEQLNYMHDQILPEKYGIGFTNMVERTTPGSKDLSSKEFREGGRLLVEKLKKYRPLIAVFNGKCIYEIFSKEVFGIKTKTLEFGLQPHKVPGTDTVCYLMPSSSARCAQFPRAQDKVHFYIKLKELRNQLRGVVRNPDVLETKYTFDLNLAKEDAKRMAIKEEQYDPGYEDFSGAYGELGPGAGQSKSRACNGIAPSAVMGQNMEGQWNMQPNQIRAQQHQ